jgi:phosphomannomutase
MLELLQQLRHKVAIGFVGGSDLAKQQEQLGSTGNNGVLSLLKTR